MEALAGTSVAVAGLGPWGANLARNFNELARLCSLTDGNLSQHLAMLSEAGLVEIKKGFDRGRPHTTCRVTAAGRKRFREYLAELEHVLRDATVAEEVKAPRSNPGLAGA